MGGLFGMTSLLVEVAHGNARYGVKVPYWFRRQAQSRRAKLKLDHTENFLSRKFFEIVQLELETPHSRVRSAMLSQI